MLGPQPNPVNSLISRGLQRESQDGREFSSRNGGGNESDGDNSTNGRDFRDESDTGKAPRPAVVTLTLCMSFRY